MTLENKLMFGCLTFAFGSLLFVGGIFIWGLLMLEDTFERQEQNRLEYQQYLQEEPIREQLMIEAKKLGYSNSDLIFNMTGLCWYDSDNDSLFGQCDGERERIDIIHEESKNLNYTLTWANPPESNIVWEKVQ